MLKIQLCLNLQVGSTQLFITYTYLLSYLVASTQAGKLNTPGILVYNTSIETSAHLLLAAIT